MITEIEVWAFTGTSKGMTRAQKAMFAYMLPVELELHHGDCVGADEDAHNIVRQERPGSLIVVHPPIKDAFRAFCEGDTILAPKDYLKRDDDIVEAGDYLVATPKGFKEEGRGSGTWYTVRQAHRVEKDAVIIFPDGTIQRRLG